jgi:hypothetical protein
MVADESGKHRKYVRWLRMNIRLLRAEEIECRVAQAKENGCSLLLYKDARCDMKILDETFGAERWQRTHEIIGDNLFCNVAINFPTEQGCDKWVVKQDVGVESYTEKEKGQASDSFKRACFNWGIGRELYTAPFIWIKLNENETYKNKNNSVGVKTKFSICEIQYEGRKISYLSIVDATGKKRYEYGQKHQDTIGQEKAEILSKLFTDLVEKGKIKPTAMKDTMKKYGIPKLADLTSDQYGHILQGLKKAEQKDV